MSVNKVILVGNLGKDPERRYTPDGTAVATFSLATSEKYKDRDGKQVETTEWHNIVVWRQLADNVAKFLAKGSKIYLEGKIKTRKYDDKDGVTRYATEIVADQIRFLDSAKDTERTTRPAAQQPTRQERPAQQSGGGFNTQDSFNPSDEIPF